MEKDFFKHSAKVPRLYKCAATIFQKVAGGAGSLKQLVYEKTFFNTKALYALIVTTFQKASELDLLFKRTKLLEKEPRLDPWLARILISELLWGKKQLPKSDAKPILTILAYEQAFRAHLSDSSVDNSSDKPSFQIKPRYVRINTLLTSLNEAIANFEEEGWILLSPIAKSYETFLEQVSNLEGDNFLKDFHIPELLIFPSGTQFYNHPGYRKGAIVLQDKASCLPVHILAPPPGSVVLDMCAAPGMKTTQLVTALQNEGLVYAVEQDSKRFEVLRKMVHNSGATCVKVFNQDVLQCGSSDFPDVEYILVDPSCSGSGMVDRLKLNSKDDPHRLEKLAGFQIKILRAALTRYPKAKKVVYSTCSLYPEENEDVVRQVLETNDQFKLIPAGDFVKNEWINYGSTDFGNVGSYCLYARPDMDCTYGFFLAVFERLAEGESNEFYNRRVWDYKKNIEKRQSRKNKKNNDIADLMDNYEEAESSNMKSKAIQENFDGTTLKTKKIKHLDLSQRETQSQILDHAKIEVKVGSKRKDKNDIENANVCNLEIDSEKPHKKKKHKRLNDIGNDEVSEIPIDQLVKKAHKKKKHMPINDEVQYKEKNNDVVDFVASFVETLNKKEKATQEYDVRDEITLEKSKRKLKHKSFKQVEIEAQDKVESNLDNVNVELKVKRKRKSGNDIEDTNCSSLETESEKPHKKEKHKSLNNTADVDVMEIPIDQLIKKAHKKKQNGSINDEVQCREVNNDTDDIISKKKKGKHLNTSLSQVGMEDQDNFKSVPEHVNTGAKVMKLSKRKEKNDTEDANYGALEIEKPHKKKKQKKLNDTANLEYIEVPTDKIVKKAHKKKRNMLINDNQL